MILSPTNVTIEGKRAWLEGNAQTDAQRKELDAALASVDYKAKAGFGLHVQYNDKFPAVQPIVKESSCG